MQKFFWEGFQKGWFGLNHKELGFIIIILMIMDFQRIFSINALVKVTTSFSAA
jgi:hypothetical protein